MNTAERFPRRVEKYVFLHVACMFFARLFRMYAKYLPALGWNSMMSPRVLIESTPGLTVLGTFE